METYFNIRYEFETEAVHQAIAARLKQPGADYICVADGVILNEANRHPGYLATVNGGMFSICDSSYVPLYIKSIYGRTVSQYCGSQIFIDIVRQRRYRMAFLGTQQPILDGLRTRLTAENPDVANMLFYELPFRDVADFDYATIARMLEADGSDIIWIALGAPKQEQFMQRLKLHLSHGVMIAVGAAFKFFSGTEVNRAPQWMVRHHLEFVHRIYKEPRKQLKRCGWIILTLPRLYLQEHRRAKKAQKKKE